MKHAWMIAVAVTGCISQFDFELAPCPCSPGYVCDSSNVCRVATDAGAPPVDAGAPLVCADHERKVGDECHRWLDFDTYFDQSCAIEGGGRVACWGACINSLVPRYVQNFDDAVELALGGTRDCALTKSGEVWCWLRVDQDIPCLALPGGAYEADRVEISSPAAHIAVGSKHACAFFLDDTYACWGDNTTGTFGTMSLAEVHYSPVYVTDGPELESVSLARARFGTTCVVHGVDENVLTCWRGYAGQRVYAAHTFPKGITSMQVIADKLVQVSVDGAVLDVKLDDESNSVVVSTVVNTSDVVGIGQGCLVRTNGRAYCYDDFDLPKYEGADFFGVVNDDVESDVVPHPANTPIRKVTNGPWHGCLLSARGEIHCFGNNYVEEPVARVPSGTEFVSPDRQTVELPPIDAMFSGQESVAAVAADGTLMTWGENVPLTMIGRRGGPTSLPGAAALRGSKAHAAAFMESKPTSRTMFVLLDTIVGSRQVWMYGDNLTSFPTVDFASGVVGRSRLRAFDGATQLCASNTRACAILDDASVHCLTTETSSVIPELLGATDIVIDRRDTFMAGIVDGRVVCRPLDGACPAGLDTVTDAVELESGIALLLIRRANGLVLRVGADQMFGASTPTPVGTVDDAAGMISHSRTWCIWETDGRTVCFGSNEHGGIDPTGPGTGVSPDAPREVGSFRKVATGSSFTCGIRTDDGRVECWGRNTACQLGRCPGLAHREPVPLPEPIER